MKEEFYQKKMIELEEAKIKALLDIRDVLHILASIGMNSLLVDERVSVENYKRVRDAVKEAHDESKKRWQNEF